MNSFFSSLVVLICCSFASADNFKFYTQVHVTPEIGNIVVSRGIATEPKYVDYMTGHREEMAEANIFPDADGGTFTENTVSLVMDDQKIEVVVRSDHRRSHGPGCTNADNFIVIRVDGIKVYESTFGDYRIQSEVYKIVVLPLDKAILVYGHNSKTKSNDSSHPDTFWYNELKSGEYYYLLEVGDYSTKTDDQLVSVPIRNILNQS